MLQHSTVEVLYGGFHLDPELASRAAGAPPARSGRGGRPCLYRGCHYELQFQLASRGTYTGR
jgi:hypothetical protein